MTRPRRPVQLPVVVPLHDVQLVLGLDVGIRHKRARRRAVWHRPHPAAAA